MANADITKQALANSLKRLMENEPFVKITVEEICSGCGMNRKSFYYHFCDKYDLLNWIFSSEFLSRNGKGKPIEQFFCEMCDYLHTNRDFYRKALRVEGTNCFSEYFRRVLSQFAAEEMRKYLKGRDPEDFYVDCLVGGISYTIERWLLEPNSMDSRTFIGKIFFLIDTITEKHKK